MTARAAASRLVLLVACLLLAGCGANQYSASQAPVVYTIRESFQSHFLFEIFFELPLGIALFLAGCLLGYMALKSTTGGDALLLAGLLLLGGFFTLNYARIEVSPSNIQLLTAEKIIACYSKGKTSRLPYDKVKQVEFPFCDAGDAQCRLTIENLEGERVCETHLSIDARDRAKLRGWFKKELGDRSKL